MDFIADGLLIATAMTAGLYCLVLSRRLRNLTDSGDGIGAQIEALDRALQETRSALAETRESVGELRTSAKSSLAQISRETALAAELTASIDGGVARAEATLQRLYQAESRIEAHQTHRERGAAAPDAPPGDAGSAGAEPPVSEAEGPGPVEDAAGEARPGDARPDAAGVLRVELPDGVEIGTGAEADAPVSVAAEVADDVAGGAGGDAEAADETAVPAGVDVDSGGRRDAKRGRGGPVLKAERVML